MNSAEKRIARAREMDREIAKGWVARLRSGHYKQRQRSLKTVHPDGETAYCCLGVLTEMYVEQNPDKDWRFASLERQNAYDIGGPYYEDYQRRNPHANPPYCVGESAYYLSQEVRDWSGVKTENGFIDSATLPLAELNDAGNDFNYIADMIEQNVDVL